VWCLVVPSWIGVGLVEMDRCGCGSDPSPARIPAQLAGLLITKMLNTEGMQILQAHY
jgi:hypothetical protein